MDFFKLLDTESEPIISRAGGHDLVMTNKRSIKCIKCGKKNENWDSFQRYICPGRPPDLDQDQHKNSVQIAEESQTHQSGIENRQKELDEMAKKQQTDIIIAVYEHHAGDSTESSVPERGESGFAIETNRQTIWLLMDDESSCCESWGYFITEDDPDKFIGEFISGITITDTNRSSKSFNKDGDYKDEGIHLDEGDVMFVDIETSAGVFQFVAYNAHNGYYGHQARIVSDFIVHTTTL